MIVVDASVWVARLVSQDAFHQPVSAWMAQKRKEGLLLVSPAILLPEVAGAIARRTGEQELAELAVAALQRLPGLRIVAMDSVLIERAAYLAGTLKLRGTDAVYVAAAEYLNLPLCTLDAEQARRAAYRVSILAVTQEQI